MINLKKNDIITEKIVDVNNLGYGIAKRDGVIIFTDGAVTHDVLEIKIIKVARDYCVGKIERIISPSNHRAEQSCPVFPRCGGCAFRHITREYEKEIKKNSVISAFKKQGINAEVNDVVSDEKTSGYRNKTQYPVSEDGKVGYYAKHSHTVIPCLECDLTDKSFKDIVAFTQQYIIENKLKVKHIYLRRGQKTGQTMLCLVTPERSFKGEREFAKSVTEKFPEIKSVLLNIHPEETNVILGKKVKLLYGEDIIYDELCSCTFGISSLSFYQVNRGCAELLYKKAIELCGSEGINNVADLYCGAGTIGISYAKANPSVSVTGVEIIPEAVENARKNAELNGIKNAKFICDDALKAPLENFDCIFIDPPRKGMDEKLTSRICESGVKKLVHVSCDPQSLARDAGILTANGFIMSSVTPFDMFPRTGHIECVTSFERS